MSTEANTELQFDLNPLEALEAEQKLDLDDRKPHSGQEIEVLNREYFVVSRGSSEGTDVYVMGEVVDEEVLPNYEGSLLREADVPENYVAHELGEEVQNQSIDYAEFDSTNENVVEHRGEKYLKLDGDL